MQAMQDFRRTQFGGWPFADAAPVHGREPKRFARHPGGKFEEPAA
jgi:quercetin 2,3-dioxygenase